MKNNYKIVTISNRRPNEWYYTYDQLFKSVGDNEILVLGQSWGSTLALATNPVFYIMLLRMD